jgi:Lrp/AsnC family transcriptional regulator for asnA, asnC and gidA
MLNSRQSFVDIARELNVTETAVRKRVRRMENQGIIERYSIDINPKKLGFGMRVLVGIDTDAPRYISIIQQLKKMDESLRIYSSSGDHDIMVEVWMKDDVELDKFIMKLKNIKGVREICPAIIKEILK